MMAMSGWTRTESPFHPGELAIQSRLGVQGRMDRQGRRVVREYLTEQHRQFFPQLPYVIAGTVDSFGHIWASILVGEPGFISSPDAQTLHVNAQPLVGDPLLKSLEEGNDIGLLGIDLSTRRRNRVNGMIGSVDTDGIDVQVVQTFGNCPQYIQSRTASVEARELAPSNPIYELTGLSSIERSLIASSDTFFIATAYQAESAGVASGVDVSHRGGRPGFVHIDPKDQLTIPDYSGNNHFNTLGNIEINPSAGLLFLDFERRDILYLTGVANVVWDGPEISEFEGAKRLLRFYPERGYRVEGSLPIRWSSPEFSPFL